jgi:hypothetical protein
MSSNQIKTKKALKITSKMASKINEKQLLCTLMAFRLVNCLLTQTSDGVVWTPGSLIGSNADSSRSLAKL